MHSHTTSTTEYEYTASAKKNCAHAGLMVSTSNRKFVPSSCELKTNHMTQQEAQLLLGVADVTILLCLPKNFLQTR